MEKTQAIPLLIYTPVVTPRIGYSFELIFTTILGVELQFTSREEEFLHSPLPKINYSTTRMNDGLFLKAHPLLHEKTIQPHEIEMVEYQGMQLFFPSSPDSFLPFDPFACAFYIVSRYEEYLSENTDEHERFTDSENILVRQNLHHTPIVDRMACWVAQKITAQFPGFQFPARTFRLITSIDIDNAWAYKNKSPMISFGAIAKAILNGHREELWQRFMVFTGLKNDPYDTYHYILETYKGMLNQLVFFILVGNRDQFDKNVSFKNKKFRQLVAHLASVCEVGIHPSYASNSKPWLFETEKERLEAIISRPVTKSRQHFLKLKFPQTYQQLIKLGIDEDYTMGFASIAGFRAGICTPYHFFDLSRNRRTNLLIQPFQVMDVTLKNYLQMDPEQAWQLIEQLMGEVKKVNGTFISLWHNESLKESGPGISGPGWRKVFEQIRQTGLKYTNE